MEKWEELEFYYAKRLRESSPELRRQLYSEAYSEVSRLSIQSFESDEPEDRTAGTSERLVHVLSGIVNRHDYVLEIGCGRGYTCLHLGPVVASMVGIEVAESSIEEARRVLSNNKITNVKIIKASAIDLHEHFIADSFDVCISIDMLEHLHPDDAKLHLNQVYRVLKPGGKYIIVMPNRFSGPHDITHRVFPSAKEALGFHLNESTYRETIRMMRAIGFGEFKVLIGARSCQGRIKAVSVTYYPFLLSEILYRILPHWMCPRILKRLIGVRLIAKK